MISYVDYISFGTVGLIFSLTDRMPFVGMAEDITPAALAVLHPSNLDMMCASAVITVPWMEPQSQYNTNLGKSRCRFWMLFTKILTDFIFQKQTPKVWICFWKTKKNNESLTVGVFSQGVEVIMIFLVFSVVLGGEGQKKRHHTDNSKLGGWFNALPSMAPTLMGCWRKLCIDEAKGDSI